MTAQNLVTEGQRIEHYPHSGGSPQVGAPMPSPESARQENRSTQQAGFIAEHSVLACDEPTQPIISESSISRSLRVRDAILSAVEAEILPVPPLRRALTDAFFEHVFHKYPIIEPVDVLSPDSSILLQQALAHTLYEKVKTLIYLNYETDSLTMLKTFCLLSCWSVRPPDKISLDGPWYWTGVASRLAIQMGLHRESTYFDNPHSHCLRKIFWHLHNGNKLQMACWGRPPCFSSTYCDVKQLTIEVFDMKNIQAEVFVSGTKLCTIIGNVAELHLERRPVSPDEVTRVTQALCRWLRGLPDDLRLYDSNGMRRKFCLPVIELFIKYFAAIILLQLLQGAVDQQRCTSLRSLIASSCMARLYEEIYFRENTTCLLPINGFLCMVASLPQIYYQPRSAEKDRMRKEEIGILCSIMTSMRGKYGGAEMVLLKIQRLQKKVGTSVEQLETDTNGLSDSYVAQRASECLEDLFPFPSSICSHMELIQRSANSETESPLQSFVPMEDEWASWLVTEGHSFVDLLGMYPSVTDVMINVHQL